MRAPLNADYVRLEDEDEDGITGFVVSPRFNGLSTLDRQDLIDRALRKAADPLTTDERRRVLMIAGLTPIEFDAVGERILVQKVQELEDGIFEVLVHGGYGDAEYVRGALKTLKGVRTTEPKRARGAHGALMAFRATGTKANPLTKALATDVLTRDRYIALLPEMS